MSSIINPFRRVTKVEIQRPGIDGSVTAIEKAQLQSDIDAVAGSISGMPEVIAGNYTKRLANYGGDLAAAIADLPDGGASGGEIQVDGEFTLASGNVIVPDGVQVIGRGASTTRILLDSAYNWPGLYSIGNSNVLFADMTLERVTGGTPLASQIGVQVFGPGGRIHMERLVIDGFYGGVRVRPGTGYTTGTVDLFDLVMRDVKVVNSSITYGIEIAGVDGFVLDNCEGSFSTTSDGLKVSGKTMNGKVIGGRFDHNGQEGIDAFTGGQNIQIIGVTCDHNTGHGTVVKTDNVSYNNPDELAPRNMQFIGCSMKHNGGHGLGVYKMASGGIPASINDQISLAQVSIIGGEYLDNAHDGIFSDARNVTMSSPRTSRNGRHGIYVGLHALHNTISAPISTGNGRLKHLNEGSYNLFGNKAANLWIRGTGIYEDGGVYIGTDADNVSNESNLISRNQTASYNVYIDSEASDVEVRPAKTRLQVESGRQMRAVGTGNGIKLHHKEAASYPSISTNFSGGPGSTYTRLTPTGNTEPMTFIKTDGHANDPLGWVPNGIPRVTTLPPSSVAYRGWMVVRRTSDVDQLMMCVQTGASTYAWRTVTLT